MKRVFLISGLTIALAVHIFPILASAQLRSSFGESCDRVLRCDSKSSLLCTNGTCACLKPDEMTFDPARSKCVVLAGERCSYTAVEILTDNTQEKRWTERLDCVSNATCNGDGYCECTSKQFETPEGHCSPKLAYGENCTKDTECVKERLNQLVCAFGKCSCNATESVRDPFAKKCLGRVGFEFYKHQGCVWNANAGTTSIDYYGGDIGYAAVPRDGREAKCRCDSGYWASSDGLCPGIYNSQCHSINYPCQESFSCNNGQCKCHFPESQSYSESKKTCVSGLLGPCKETIDGKVYEFECPENSFCSTNNGVSECKCVDGYIPSTDGNCKKQFGAPCWKDTECDRVPRSMLECRNGTCACNKLEIHDGKWCRGLYGAACNPAWGKPCVDGLICEGNRFNWKTGICRCLPNLTLGEDRRCTSPTFNQANDKSNDTVIELIMGGDGGVGGKFNVRGGSSSNDGSAESEVIDFDKIE